MGSVVIFYCLFLFFSILSFSFSPSLLSISPFLPKTFMGIDLTFSALTSVVSCVEFRHAKVSTVNGVIGG